MRLYEPLLPLSELIEQLRAREARMHDKVVSAGDMSIDSDTGHLLVRNGQTSEFPFQSQAFDLLCQKLRVPASYMRRAPNWLVAENLNTWLRASPERRMFLRFDANECRAVLSPRYQPLSHVELAETVYSKMGDADVRAEISPTQMLMQVLSPEAREVSRGDAIRGAIFTANSETGARVCLLQAATMRLACSNGLLLFGGMSTFQKRHVSPAPAVLAELSLRIEQALVQGLSSIRRLGDTRFILVPDPMTVFDRIAGRYSFDEAELEATKSAFHVEPGDSLWSVIQAVTRAANEPSLSIDAREKLQATGGRILELAERGSRWID